jgi:hypothetical protein
VNPRCPWASRAAEGSSVVYSVKNPRLAPVASRTAEVSLVGYSVKNPRLTPVGIARSGSLSLVGYSVKNPRLAPVGIARSRRILSRLEGEVPTAGACGHRPPPKVISRLPIVSLVVVAARLETLSCRTSRATKSGLQVAGFGCVG